MARQFKHFAEKVKGFTLQAKIDKPDADGFGRVSEWQVLKDGKVVHTNSTNMKARSWIIRGQPSPAPQVSPS